MTWKEGPAWSRVKSYCVVLHRYSWWIHWRKLKANKSLEAYHHYFTSDWVGTCLVHEVNKEFIALKALGQPCQHLSKPPHHPWIVVKRKMAPSVLLTAPACNDDVVQLTVRSITSSRTLSLHLFASHINQLHVFHFFPCVFHPGKWMVHNWNGEDPDCFFFVKMMPYIPQIFN